MGVNHGLTPEDADTLLDPVVDFPEIGAVFERVRPITDFRKDDNEARVLYICRRIDDTSTVASNGEKAKDDLYVLKCKVQAPSVLAGGITTPRPGPSEYGAAEIQALTKFTDTKSVGLPHLICWKVATQGDNGPMPGGYIVYTVMTLMPGRDLWESKYWSMDEPAREVIQKAFIPLIKNVWRMGFDPYDTALRNILWEPDTKQISLVDFEHWHIAKDPINMGEREELERWGLVQRKVAPTHWQEWFHSEGLTRQKQ